MAFPTVQTADAQSGVQTSNSTSWTLTYPTNLASGDLILAFIAADGSGAQTSTGFPSPWANWVINNSSGSAVSMCVGAKISDGTETGTFTWTANASEQGGWRLIRVTGWYNHTLPTFPTLDSDGLSSKFASATSGTTPNPPSNDPANWDVEDTLWFAVAAVDTSRTFSAWPSGYTPGNNTWDNVSGGAGGASLSVQYRTNAAASEDPGTWTISASDDWATLTIAVRPAAAVTPLNKEFFNRRDYRRAVQSAY